MTLRDKILAGAFYSFIFLVILLTLLPVMVKANPSIFGDTKETATATTSMNHITAGVATTTLIYDTLSGDAVKADAFALNIQFTASSSLAVLRWRYEWAQSRTVDCVATPLKCDWYGDSIDPVGTATSTSLNIESYNEHSWTFASSTLGSSGNSAGGNSIANKLVYLPKIPTRFIRVLFYVPPGAGNADVWAQIIPIKEKVSK